MFEMEWDKVINGNDGIYGFIQDFMQKAGKEKLIVGVSGGIDSALVLELAVGAIGRENVYALTMPHEHSDTRQADIIIYGLLHADNVLTQSQELVHISVTNQVNTYFEQILGVDWKKEELSKEMRLRVGNKCARERMSILYDLSAEYDALVLATGNKTESLLGYTTLWGDMLGALAPIADLYKTQVRGLSRYLNGVSKLVVDIAPSADLWVGQTDEGEIGATYEEIDLILDLTLEKDKTRYELVSEFGLNEEKIDRVMNLYEKNSFKREAANIDYPILRKYRVRK